MTDMDDRAKTAQRRAQVRDMRASGMTFKAIAAQLGISSSRAW